MKTRGMSVLRSICVIGAIIISLLACGDQSSKIIGIWKLEDILLDKSEVASRGAFIAQEMEKSLKRQLNELKKSSTAEFYKDKSFIIDIGGRKLSGNWLYLEDGRIKLNYIERNADIAKIEGEKIIIKSPSDAYFGNDVFVFTR